MQDPRLESFNHIITLPYVSLTFFCEKPSRRRICTPFLSRLGLEKITGLNQIIVVFLPEFFNLLAGELLPAIRITTKEMIRQECNHASTRFP